MFKFNRYYLWQSHIKKEQMGLQLSQWESCRKLHHSLHTSDKTKLNLQLGFCCKNLFRTFSQDSIGKLVSSCLINYGLIDTKVVLRNLLIPYNKYIVPRVVLKISPSSLQMGNKPYQPLPNQPLQISPDQISPSQISPQPKLALFQISPIPNQPQTQISP